MANPSATPSSIPSWMERFDITDPSARPFPYLVTAFLLAIVVYSLQGPRYPKNIKHLNPRGPLEFSDTRPKKEFVDGSREMIAKWFKANPDKPCRVISDFGEVILLPPRFANEIKSDDQLSFSKWSYKAFHAHLPGFEGFREGSRDSHIVQEVIMRDLTKYLNKVTEPLAEETSLAIEDILPKHANGEWSTINIRQKILPIIARISSRVFLGEELCRNEEWLKVTQEYTLDGFRAAEELRLWPAALRPIVHWFLPSCQAARAHVRVARSIIDPVLKKRRQEKAANGGKAEHDDAIEWFERTAKGKYYDPAVAQLNMSLAAIHTTSDLVCQVMTDLMHNPEYIAPLREEMIQILSEGGWKKTSLYNMKLLDSVIKESQRVKPIGMASMRRYVGKDLTLSDGTFIPKGGNVAVSAHNMWDSEVYEQPDKWDGRRFLRMRETPGKENMAQLVSTGPDHLGFGHGQHACPGRFFAANEVKIAVIYLLLNYEWRLPEGSDPKVRTFGFSMGVDPSLKVEYKGRQAEIEL
ncbi:putative cytochrome P450 monooxygenase [Neurospora tetraspora]|uniref:Cytochrome P450 monooxygenase n=1 Tax=Neurospora tetraspora TaxID=94610 RepID=A0AAE0JF39_9PEZI|nr:putative cytochrome P450 monooxygenase [Neurospora tetraspora]